jgi:hypothetical protein
VDKTIALQEIMYRPLSKTHIIEIKTYITIYKFNTKAPFFAIPKDPTRPNSIIPCAPRTWEEIQNL